MNVLQILILIKPLLLIKVTIAFHESKIPLTGSGVDVKKLYVICRSMLLTLNLFAQFVPNGKRLFSTFT